MFETYYTPSTKGEKLPVKWMAPEVCEKLHDMYILGYIL